MKSRTRAFTLIEILVVVAIIALLIAILLPSLARAKQQARMIQCQSNMRQLTIAFTMYSSTNQGRLPGMYNDPYADWMGLSNRYRGNTRIGRQPQDGVVWKYMGSQQKAYVCPDDPKVDADYSYTTNVILTGAKTEMLAGAHYPTRDFNSSNHTGTGPPMRPFEGAPLLIEEDYDFWLNTTAYSDRHEDGWSNDDRISERHLRSGTGRGYGNIGFADGHSGKVQLYPGKLGAGTSAKNYFCADSMCIRLKGKWVSGWSWGDNCSYGYMDHAKPASNYGITH